MPDAVTFADLSAAAAWCRQWLVEDALPLWSRAGVDPRDGGFVESLSVTGEPLPVPRRCRVQTRQVWVYASAAKRGLPGPWLAIANRGFDAFMARYRRADGLFIRLADADGAVLDDTAYLYEQAFALLAMSALYAADPARGGLRDLAAQTLKALGTFHNPAGGWREAGDDPFQANAHMHMLEACLSWEDAGAEEWRAVSDEIVGLCLNRFIEPETGVLREFFDADWIELPGEGGLIEPGHQFEWAWLLDRWGGMRGDEQAKAAARRLYDNGLRGVDPARGVAVNALWDDFSVREPAARLWPQTEYLKAALIFGDEAQGVAAAQALALYLATPARGAWRDKLQADGAFTEEAAPATSLYHIYGCVAPLLDKA